MTARLTLVILPLCTATDVNLTRKTGRGGNLAWSLEGRAYGEGPHGGVALTRTTTQCRVGITREAPATAKLAQLLERNALAQIKERRRWRSAEHEVWSLSSPVAACPWSLVSPVAPPTTRLRDSGTWLCGLNEIGTGTRTSDETCVVYAFGAEQNMRFEHYIRGVTDCEVHIFDPMPKASTISGFKPPTQFHAVGLGRKAASTSPIGPVLTLSDICSRLGHVTVDVLKLDIMGPVYAAILATDFAVLPCRIGQIAMQVGFRHFAGGSNESDQSPVEHVARTFDHLEDAGFRQITLGAAMRHTDASQAMALFLHRDWTPTGWRARASALVPNPTTALSVLCATHAAGTLYPPADPLAVEPTAVGVRYGLLRQRHVYPTQVLQFQFIRYWSVLQDKPDGQVVLFARRGHYDGEHATIVALLDADGALRQISPDSRPLEGRSDVASNLGALVVPADDGQPVILAVGGARDGVRLFSLRNKTGTWNSERVVLKRNHPGCIERRLPLKGVCQFDGKFSLVAFQGRFLIYARANVNKLKGGRFVQVASARNVAGPYGPFALVDFLGYGKIETQNMYMLAVNVHPFRSDRLIGLAPINFSHGKCDARCGLYLAFSCDGVICCVKSTRGSVYPENCSCLATSGLWPVFY